MVTADERWWPCEQQLLTGVRPEPHTHPKALTEHKDGRLMGVGCRGRPSDSDLKGLQDARTSAAILHSFRR